MTIGELMDRILIDGPITEERLISAMEHRRVAEVFTVSVLTGRYASNELELRDGLVYKKEKP
jgi:hypothetical protein